MNKYKLTLPETYSHDSAASSLRAVAVYDELISLVHAQEALSSLAHATRDRLPLHRSLWSFARLMRLDVRHESIRVASEADIILVAASATIPIPSHVISWLNSSLRENGKGTPVLVAFDVESNGNHQPQSSLLTELGDLATRWELPLICNFEFDECLEAGLIPELTQRNTSFSSFGSEPEYERLLSAPNLGRWGLNE